MTTQQAINAGFARSEQLKHEWTRLRDDMQAIDTNTPRDKDKRRAIHTRMDQIMNEMANVLTQTRRLIPTPDINEQTSSNSNSPTTTTSSLSPASPPNHATASPPNLLPAATATGMPLAATMRARTLSRASPDDDDDDDDDDFGDLALDSVIRHSLQSAESSASSKSQLQTSSPRSTSSRPRLQYSARRRHVVRRTYDSTSSESSAYPAGDDDNDSTDTDDSGSVDLPVNDVDDDRDGNKVDQPEALRRALMHDAAPTDEVVTVEHRAHRGQLASIKRGLRSRFRSTAMQAVRAQQQAQKAPMSADANSTMSYASPLRDRTPSPAPAAPTPPGSPPDDGGADALDDLSIPASSQAPPSSSATTSLFTANGNGGLALLTDEEREAMSIEQSRLERESRRLKRKPNRTPVDESRLLDIASTLSKLSSTLADAGNPSDSVRMKGLMSPMGGGPMSHRMEREREMLRMSGGAGSGAAVAGGGRRGTGKGGGAIFSPMTEEEDVGVEGTEEELSPATNGATPRVAGASSKAAAQSKRKKTWMAFDMGVASIKALSRSVRGNNGGGEAASSSGSGVLPPTTPGGRGRRGAAAAHGHAHEGRGRRGGGGNGNGNGDVYAEMGHRVAERGEKLGAAADVTGQMASDAGDMAAAARALRQRQQKGMF